MHALRFFGVAGPFALSFCTFRRRPRKEGWKLVHSGDRISPFTSRLSLPFNFTLSTLRAGLGFEFDQRPPGLDFRTLIFALSPTRLHHVTFARLVRQCFHDADGRDDRFRASRARAQDPLRPPLRGAMPRRGRKARAPVEHADWQALSHARIRARAEERADDTGGPSYEHFEKLATAPIKAIASGEPIAPGELQMQRTAAQTARFYHRTTREGQAAAGFDPNRYSVMICGRPVQVTMVWDFLECLATALTCCLF